MYLSLGHLGIFTLFVLCLYWNKMYITLPLYTLLRRRVNPVTIPVPSCFYVDKMALEIFIDFENGQLVFELLHGLPTIFQLFFKM